MNFDIYVKKTENSPDIEVWTTVSIREFIQSAVKIDQSLSKASLEVDPVIVSKLGDGTSFYTGDLIKISFKSLEMNQEEFAFLRSLAEDNLDVIFLDNEGNIVYGCRKAHLDIHPVQINESKLIQIAGSREGFENLIFYRIKPFSVKISYPRNGFIYNDNVNSVFGISL